jgi:TRAP-type C4-dicarboxylate transport system permease large subunit
MGIDPVFFGVMMVLNLMIGMLTPPFGIVLFTLAKISDESIESVVREIWPFILALVMVLALLVAFPSLVTFIPNNFNI